MTHSHHCERTVQRFRRRATHRLAQHASGGRTTPDHEAFTIGHERATDDALQRPHARRQSPTCLGCPYTPAGPITGHPDCLSGGPHAHLTAHRSTRLEQVESTRTPRPGSRRNSLGKPAPIRSIHLLHGQPTRTSGELECERNYMDQQRCVHRTRRTWCSAKHTCRMSVWWWRRAVALQADDEHHVRHGRAVGAPPAASTGDVSNRRTQPAPRRLRVLAYRLLQGRRPSKLRDETFRPRRGWTGLGPGTLRSRRRPSSSASEWPE